VRRAGRRERRAAHGLDAARALDRRAVDQHHPVVAARQGRWPSIAISQSIASVQRCRRCVGAFALARATSVELLVDTTSKSTLVARFARH
jgi:hypothetical protein